MILFNVTYEQVTPESAEYGDVSDSGFIGAYLTLHEALEALNWQGCHIEGNSCPANGCDWITAYKTNDGTMEYYKQGIEESRSLHFPDSMTDSSRNRLMRLLGVYGMDK